MSSERVRVDVADHIATVTLTRPDKHNALDIPMFEGIIGAAAQLSEEPGVRAVVLHGEGPSFCSGLDVMGIMAGGQGLDGLTDPLRGEVPNWFQRAAYDWITLPMPVIAAVHGACFGGGLQIALAADVRLTTSDARLSVMEIRWGLIPDMSITRTLPRLVGIDVAKELTYTGRIFSGEEALGLGVATHVSEDPLASARALATEIAAKSPDAVRGAKRLYDEAWNAPAQQSLALEAELQRSLIGSPNQLAAVAAGVTKQPAEFTDPASGVAEGAPARGAPAEGAPAEGAPAERVRAEGAPAEGAPAGS
jgi:enoyl-CoA hydratase/carnithine racemase